MICLEIPPPTFDFIDAYYMIITSMIGKREKNSHRAKRVSVGLHRLVPCYLVLHTMFLVVLAVAIVVAVVGNISYAKTDSGGGAGKKDEFPIGQYCKEQEALGKNPIICKSPEEQGKAKINDPTGYQKAMAIIRIITTRIRVTITTRTKIKIKIKVATIRTRIRMVAIATVVVMAEAVAPAEVVPVARLTPSSIGVATALTTRILS